MLLLVFDPLQLYQKLNFSFWIWYKHPPALTTQAAALTFWLDPYLLILLPRHTLCLSLSSIHCSSLYGCVPCGKININLTVIRIVFSEVYLNKSVQILCNSGRMHNRVLLHTNPCAETNEHWFKKRLKGNRTVFPTHIYFLAAHHKEIITHHKWIFLFWHCHSHIRHIVRVRHTRQLLNSFIICHNQYFCTVLECTTNVRRHTHATLL